MNSYRASHGDLESGQGQYALQDRSNIAVILSKRRKIEQELAKVTQTQQQLKPAQQALLDSITPQDDYATRTEVESLEYEITESFRVARALAAEATQEADASNPRVREQLQHIGNIIRKQIEEYRRLQSDFAGKLESQIRRRYALVHADATEEEITEGVQSVLLGNEQVFQVSGTRSAQAHEARAAVLQRSVAIRKVAEDLQALNELFEEVGMLVQMQDEPVEEIAKNAEVTVENYKQSTRLLDRAIFNARNARKYKWWILGVCILILAIIAVVIYMAVSHGKK